MFRADRTLLAGVGLTLAGLARMAAHAMAPVDPFEAAWCRPGELLLEPAGFLASLASTVHCWGCPVALSGAVVIVVALARRGLARA